MNYAKHIQPASWLKTSATLVVVAIIIGVIFVLAISHASSPTSAIEAENGTVSSAANDISDTSASNNSAVKFGDGSGNIVDRCPAYPAFPDASCTGVESGITLTPSGSITVTTDNAVIQDLDISGSVTIKANNVLIKNCKIDTTGYYNITVSSGSVIIDDVELTGANAAAITGDNWQAYNVNIHDMHQDGLKGGNNIVLEGSYLHDFTPSAGAHPDGIQISSGVSNLTIRHNYVDGPDNSAVFFKNDFGPDGSGPYYVDKNEIGGGNYTLYLDVGNQSQPYTFTHLNITDNVFLSDAAFGPFASTVDLSQAVDTWSGNTYNGQPFNMPGT